MQQMSLATSFHCSIDRWGQATSDYAEELHRSLPAFGFITFDTEQAVDDLLDKGNKLDFAGAHVSTQNEAVLA